MSSTELWSANVASVADWVQVELALRRTFFAEADVPCEVLDIIPGQKRRSQLEGKQQAAMIDKMSLSPTDRQRMTQLRMEVQTANHAPSCCCHVLAHATQTSKCGH